MKNNCVICGDIISIQPTRNYCVRCGSSYDNKMRLILSRHNWNLEDYSKSFLKDAELSRLKHQN